LPNTMESKPTNAFQKSAKSVGHMSNSPSELIAYGGQRYEQ